MEETYEGFSEYHSTEPDPDEVMDFCEVQQGLSESDAGFLMGQVVEYGVDTGDWQADLEWAMETYGYGVR